PLAINCNTRQVVERYWLRMNNPTARGGRVIGGALLFSVLAFAALIAFGMPLVPARGVTSYLVTQAILVVSVVSWTALLFYALDFTLLCERFLREMTYAVPTIRTEGIEDRPEFCWRLTRGIADHTGAIGAFIYYPFVGLLLLLAARSRLFDAWSMTPALIA